MIIMEKAPKIWQGNAMAFDELICIEAQMIREILGTGVRGEHYIKGKIKRMPHKLLGWISGRLTVNFGEFQIKMKLLDKDGNVMSVGVELGGKEPAELWLRSGGE